MAGNLSRGNDLGIGQGKWLKILTICGIIFLLLPLIILIAFSFNESRTVTHWTGFSLKWYKTMFRDTELWLAVKNTLLIGVVSTFVTTILGTMGAILMAKYRFRGKELFQNMLYIPVLLPEIIFGVSLLALFLLIKFPLGLVSIICAHITFCFPFVTMIVHAKVINLPSSLEEASLDLGASRWQTYKNVILPNIAPGIVSGAMYAFTMSIDDFVITFFTAGVGSSTLPLKIYSLIKFGITPSINAISTILIVFTIVAIVLINSLQESKRVSKKLKRGLLVLFALIVGILIVSPFFAKKEKKLNIYNYSSYLDESIIEKFEKETGIHVTLDYYNDNEELYSRLRMGATGYDIIFPSGYMVAILKKDGLISPIDYGAIPNYKYIVPSFKKMPYDTTGQYFIPYTYGFTGVVYNSDFVKDTIDSWEDLWDARYKGKILMLDDMRETFYVALKMQGKHFVADTSVLNPARDLLIKQKPLLQKYESNATEDRMLSGEAWIAQAWNGSIARLNLADPKFKSATLSEGMLYWTDNVCIPASASHKENAEMFIDFLLRPENSAQNVKSILYGMPNDSARNLLEPSLRNNTIIFPSVKDASKLDMIEEKDNLNQLLDKAWTEVKMK